MLMLFWWLLPTFCCIQLTISEEISCRNEYGKAIDWFYLYKLPRHFAPKNYEIKDETGLRYLYISSEENNWIMSDKFINESNSFAGQTLGPIQHNHKDSIVIAYNDEDPNGSVDFKNGHTKGVVAANNKTGFWLIHSVPKFPDMTTVYNYPQNGLHYGQSFLCISLSKNDMDNIGTQLIFNEPNVYYSRIPDNLIGKYPNFDKVIDKKWRTVAPYYNSIEFQSIRGTKFISFAKSDRFLKELYEDFVAPQFQVDLFVESWRLGPGNLATNCTKPFHVMNVKEIREDNFGILFNTTADHSKWCVAANKPFICVGDINRQEHQLMRGGGTVCQFTNSNLANSYRTLITNFEGCPN